MKLILGSIALITIISVQVVGQNACIDPSQRTGYCIPIKQCASLVGLLKKKISGSERNYLQQSQCGWEGNQPRVCCADNGPNFQPSFNTGFTNAPRPIPTRPIVNPGTGDRSSLLPEIGSCGLQIGNRIFGGRATNLDEHPWIAILEYSKPDGSRGFHCGGALINDRYIVTAAHCIPSAGGNPSFRLTNVRLGEYNLNTDLDCSPQDQSDCADPPQNILVEQQIVHEGYNLNTNHHDIALLRLSQPVRQTYYVKPICLPIDVTLRSPDSSVGQRFDVAGWGRTEWGYKSAVKLKVEVRGTTNQECGSVYARSASPKEIIDNQLCAGGERGKDSCNGDSGGPLMGFHQDNNGNAYWYLAGVVSYGPSECGLPGWPGVYTRVSSYLNWIQSKLRP